MSELPHTVAVVQTNPAVVSRISTSDSESVIETPNDAPVNIITVGDIGPPGPIGPEGPPGPMGPAGVSDKITRIAAQDIGGHRAVSITELGVVHADNRTSGIMSLAGVSMGSAMTGEDVDIAVLGVLPFPYDMVEGSLVYVGEDGALTSTVPESGYIRRVGIALTQRDLLLNIGETFQLG